MPAKQQPVRAELYASSGAAKETGPNKQQRWRQGTKYNKPEKEERRERMAAGPKEGCGRQPRCQPWLQNGGTITRQQRLAVSRLQAPANSTSSALLVIIRVERHLGGFLQQDSGETHSDHRGSASFCALLPMLWQLDASPAAPPIAPCYCWPAKPQLKSRLHTS